MLVLVKTPNQNNLHWRCGDLQTAWRGDYFAHILFRRLGKTVTRLSHEAWNLNKTAGIKGTSVFHKTVRVCHVYCNFKIGFTCRISVIFGTLKDGSLLINTLASNICFSYRNMFQNGVDALSKIVDAFLSKSLKFYLVWIIW